MSEIRGKKLIKCYENRDNKKLLNIVCETTDKKLKQKSHFHIKYDFSVNTTADDSSGVSLATLSSCESAAYRRYSKDSFSRFGDDLSELVLSFLTFEQKFSYQGLCKQWQRLVFGKQNKLFLCNFDNKNTAFNSIQALVVRDESGVHTVDRYLFERLLKKCTNITEIYINFNKKYSKTNEKYLIEDNFFQVLISAGVVLKKFTICSKVRNLSEETCVRFGERYAKCLQELRFKYLSDRHLKQMFLSTNSFPKLEKLNFSSIKRESNEDFLKYFTTKRLFPKLKSIKYTFSGFDGYKLVSSPDFGRLKTLDIVLDSDLNPELAGTGVDRALTLMSELKCLEIFNIKIYVENIAITAIDRGLRQMARSCLQLKRLDFIMDSIVLNDRLFEVFSGFQALEFCEISIEYNEELEDYGLIESFAKCKSLRVFNLYLYNICDKHLVDIDIYLPKITNFHLKSRTGVTDSTLNYLRNCQHLEVIEVHTYDDRKTRVNISDSGICLLINSCPKLRIVLLFSRQRIVGFGESLKLLIERARSRPKVIHIMGSCMASELCQRLAQKYKKWTEFTLLLPENLRLVELPVWEQINDFSYYCNKNVY